MESTASQSDEAGGDREQVQSFLRETVLGQDEELDWLQPLAERSLHRAFSVEELEARVSRTFDEFHPDERDYRDLIRNLVEPEGGDGNEGGASVVRRIQSLDLLRSGDGDHEIEDVTLTEGLNILYSRDREEQNRTWEVLRDALGVTGEPFSPGFGDCSLVLETGEEAGFSVSSGSEETSSPPLEVRAFDRSLSQFLLRRTSSGDYEVAPLQAERIVRLRENLTYLHGLFGFRLEELEWLIADDIVFLEDQAGFSLEEEFEPNLDAVESMKFSPRDKSTLDEKLQELERLEDDTETEEVQRLSRAVEQLRELLERVGRVEEVGGSLRFDPLPIKEMGKRLRAAHGAVERVEKLASMLDPARLARELPAEWTEGSAWEDFQRASGSFVTSVVERIADDLDRDLQEAASAPPDLGQDIERPDRLRERLEAWLEEEHERLESVLEGLRSLLNPSPELGDVLEERDLMPADPRGLEEAVDRLGQYLADLREGRDPASDLEALGTVKEALERLHDVVQKLTEHRDELHNRQSRNLDRIQELREGVRDLKLRRAVVEHRDRILNYLTHRKELAQVREVLSDLNRARQSVVSESDRFSRDRSSHPFEDRLSREYEQLDFVPPEEWDLEPEDGADPEAPYVRVHGEQLAQVLDPQQQKLQSLADFLARAGSREYEGMFLLQDPLRDLDEHHAPLVARRLFRLAAEGHQVLLLVHDRTLFKALLGLSREEREELAREEHQLIVHPDVYSWKKKTLVKHWTQLESRIDPLRSKNTGGSLTRIGVSEEDLRTIPSIYESMNDYLEHFLEVFFLKNILNQFRPSVRLGTLNRLTEIAPDKVERIEEDLQALRENQSEDLQTADQPGETLQELLRHFKRLQEHYHYQQV